MAATSFIVRCDDALVKRLDDRAKKLGVSRNEVVVRGLAAALTGAKAPRPSAPVAKASGIIPPGVQIGPAPSPPGSRLKGAKRPAR